MKEMELKIMQKQAIQFVVRVGWLSMRMTVDNDVAKIVLPNI